ncbi:nitrite reductase (NADH) small subunit [Herbihabitans rhizosphaerae]|uniref:Nitrite reductase (NADH) small subunit n=1 Tax=Herbihabitans rhizosphaerae TaxID=1872711 RepID=A0A4Q7KJU1_9PSEU|nr:nitrite reductase small subunit NirD [Herbihabitans rhizosphaerae]RZS34904.1 nitrite reductase (NADH) small subunit [Herbihabitans rhizosphaerae]
MTSIDIAWLPVCRDEVLAPEHGVAVLLPGGEQAAVFRTHDGDLHALSNVDPFSGAAVLARGIVGDLAGVPMVASPMHKQHFDLRTGVCLEDPEVSVRVYPVRIEGGMIMVGSP